MTFHRSRSIRPGQMGWESNADQLLLVDLASLNPWYQPEVILSKTDPDFAIDDDRSPIGVRPVYIDGPPHLKIRTEEKDAHVEKCLRCLDIPFERFSYDYPITQDRRREIAAALKETFGVKE